LVIQELKDHKVLKDIKELKGRLVIRVLKDLKELKDT
jgi:uncharacterized membrane protein